VLVRTKSMSREHKRSFQVQEFDLGIQVLNGCSRAGNFAFWFSSFDFEICLYVWRVQNLFSW